MAIADMFLLIEGQKTGKIVGESRDAVYPDQIDLIGWSWGMSTSTVGGMSTSTRTALSELSVVKKVDTASTALMSVMRNNELIKKGVLTVRKAGSKPIDYFTVTFERARITAYDVCSDDGPELTERLSIAFEKIEIQYFAQDDKGAKKGGSTFMTEVTRN
jgi:type VI secretion system secreted protein Hcp